MRSKRGSITIKNMNATSGGRAAAGQVIMSHQDLDWRSRGGVGGVASTTKRTPPEAREPSQGWIQHASCVQLCSAALCRRHKTARPRVDVDLTGGTMLRRTKRASRLASTREEIG